MAHPTEQFKANLMAIQNAVPKEFLDSLDATNIQIRSERTISFDLKNPAADGTNRVKITVENGKFLIRGYKVEETEIFYDIPSEKVIDSINNLINVI